MADDAPPLDHPTTATDAGTSAGPAAGERSAEATLAWRNAVAGSELVLAGQLALLAVGYDLFGPTTLFWARCGHALLVVAILVALLGGRRRPTVGAMTAAFSVVVLTLLPLFWFTELELLQANRPWAPFIGHRLLMLAIALLMPGPELWAGALVAIVAASAMTQFWGFGLAHRIGIVNAGEPWITLVYAALATGLLVVRRQHREQARQLASSVADAAALRSLGRFLVALRDLSNTPIQTLEIDTAILERRHPEDKAALRRMRNAVGQLRELSRILARSDEIARWGPGRDHLDATEALRWLERAGGPSPPAGGDAPTRPGEPDSPPARGR